MRGALSPGGSACVPLWRRAAATSRAARRAARRTRSSATRRASRHAAAGARDAGRAREGRGGRAGAARSPATRRSSTGRPPPAQAIHAVQPRDRGAGAGDPGRPVQAPVEAPQGPTCIYRPREGERLRHRGDAGDATFEPAQAAACAELRRVAVSDRIAYCGTYGQPMLYVPLPRGRVLSIAAPCDVAQRFAAQAIRHLSSCGPRRGCTRSPTPRHALRGHRRLLARGRTGRASAARSCCSGSRACFTDISSEMVVDGAAALPRLRRRLLAARVRAHRRPLQRRDGDRAAGQRLHRRPLARHKEVAATGYGLSAMCKLLLVDGRDGAARRSAPSCCSTAPARASAPRRATR